MGVRIAFRDQDDRVGTGWKIAGAALIGAAVAVGLGYFLARDQMQRNRRELFSPHPLRRLAALGYLKSNPAVDDVPLLRDYLAWEERPLLRKRATAILTGLEDALAGPDDQEGVEGA
jgi:hypothetical protein